MAGSPIAAAPAGAQARARRERALALALALAAAALLLFECRTPRAQIDDAYISYRYAANLVEGRGLVYNAGEYVEGYTNLLWTLAVAAGLALGGDAERIAHGLGVASGLLLLAATAAFAWSSLPAGRRGLAGLAPWIVLADPALVVWSESGLESALFAALATAALCGERRDRRGLALLCCGIATLTRPEGVLLTAVVLGPGWLRELRAGRPPWAPVLAYALGLAALTAFRLLYYGSPLPNTFFAKVTTDVSLGQGLLDVARFLFQGPGLLLPAAALSLAWDRRGAPGALWATAVLAYLVAIGGDTIGPTRFLLPALPVLAGLALVGVVRGAARAPALGLLLAALTLAAPLWSALPRPASGGAEGASSPRARTIESVRSARQTARSLVAAKVRRLARMRPPVALVAATGIGYLGYASRLPLIDLLGLTDAVIARTPLRESGETIPLAGHRRSNAGSVLARRPDYILIGRDSELLQAQRDLLAHPEFRRLYCFDERMRAWARCDRLPPALRGSGPGGATQPEEEAAARPARRPKKEPSPSDSPLL